MPIPILSLFHITIIFEKKAPTLQWCHLKKMCHFQEKIDRSCWNLRVKYGYPDSMDITHRSLRCEFLQRRWEVCFLFVFSFLVTTVAKRRPSRKFNSRRGDKGSRMVKRNGAEWDGTGRDSRVEAWGGVINLVSSWATKLYRSSGNETRETSLAYPVSRSVPHTPLGRPLRFYISTSLNVSPWRPFPSSTSGQMKI